MSEGAAPPTTDPAELDRFLDGACTPTEADAWTAAIAADPDLAERIATRRAFLGGLQRAGRRVVAAERAAVPPGLEARVRSGLAASGSRQRSTIWRYAAAAVVVLAIGVAWALHDPEDAVAVPQAVLSAAEIARTSAPAAPSAGCDDPDTSPHAFPLVRDGELYVATCEPDDSNGTRARLHHVEDGPVVGYVAVPDDVKSRASTVGKTVLGDVIVYDVMFGRSRAYLAVKSDFVAKNGECAACHDKTRVGKRNPHLIELRRW